jgi:flagellar basal-body rod modification protein FlgD
MPVDGVNNYNNIFTNTTSESADTKNDLDKNAFLKLLVAEIQNQNPLEPMDNQKFVEQMTQFSTMEQMTNMSESFQEFMNASMATTRLQASAVVGKYAVIEGNEIKFRDNSAESIVFNVEEQGEVLIRITNPDGKLIREENLGYKEAGIHGYQWDGRDDSGTMQAEGTYNYQLVVVDSTGQEKTFGGVDGGTVEAVQFVDNNIYVIVNGQKYNFEDIIEISEAPEETQET